MDEILVTGEKVSKKSRSAFCLKPFATSLALNLSIVPSELKLFPKDPFTTYGFATWW
jgi:hypothetical protein